MIFLNLCSDLSGDLFLFRRMIKDGGPVLSPVVWTLIVECCGVMHSVKKLHESCIVDLVVGGILNLQSLSVLRDACADLWTSQLVTSMTRSKRETKKKKSRVFRYLLVGWVLVHTTRISNSGLDVFVLVLLLESLLDAPMERNPPRNKVSIVNRFPMFIAQSSGRLESKRKDRWVVSLNFSYQKHPAAKVAFSVMTVLVVVNALEASV
jgi:hypothetical protein